jgi:hypothetical protein
MATLLEVKQRIKQDNDSSAIKIYLSKVNSATFLLFARPFPDAAPQLLGQAFSPEQALKESRKIRRTLEKSLQPRAKKPNPSVWSRCFHQLKCYVSLM